MTKCSASGLGLHGLLGISLETAGIPITHFPCLFPHPTLPGKCGIWARSPSTKDGQVPQGLEPLDDTLSHAGRENAPRNSAKTTKFMLTPRREINFRVDVHEDEYDDEQQEQGRRVDIHRMQSQSEIFRTGSTPASKSAVTSELETHVRCRAEL